MDKYNKLDKSSYNFAKSIKDKEQKVLNYYKRISNIEQPKVFAVPKRKKATQKNINAYKKQNITSELDNNDNINSNININNIKSDKDKKEDEKKLTKKKIVIMDD
jgi:hypothetical protein